VPAAPTVFGPDRLQADIAADFALRGIVVGSIDVGAWNLEWHQGPSRVVIGVGKGQYANAADTFHSTDGNIDIGNGQVASARLASVWTFPVWVRNVAPTNTPPDQQAFAQMMATMALADQAAAAIARTRGGLPLLPWPIEVLSEERGEFVDGSAIHFEAIVAIPVFDDPSDTMTADSVITGGQIDINGTLAPTSPEISTSP
jgi:hypothetical protein